MPSDQGFLPTKYSVVAGVQWHPCIKRGHVQASPFNGKSYGYGRGVMGAGASDYWQPLFRDLHGGDGCTMVILYWELRPACSVVAAIITDQACFRSTLLTVYEEGTRKGALSSICLISHG